jgi:hypothetical protein
MNVLNRSTQAKVCAAALVALVLGNRSNAQQEVIEPLPSSISSILQQAGIPQPALAQDPSSIASADRPESPFRYPPFEFSPHFLYRFLYAYGLQVRPGHSTTTLIDTFAPGITVAIGSQWTADYTANWDVYSNHAFTDTLGHTVSVVGTDTFDDWTAHLTQGYIYSSQPLVETGVQTTEQDYNTALDISHDLGRQLLIETILNQKLRYAVNFPDTYEWFVDEWLHYRFSSRFDSAIGATEGYVHESRGSDTNYWRPEAKLTWQPTDKITLTAAGGLEHRVFLDYPRTSIDTPTYDLSAQYAPVETTKLAVDFTRQVTPSYFSNESTRVAKADVSLTQRLLGRVYLVGSIGQSDVAYISAGTTSVARDDTQTSYDLKLSTSFLRRGTFSLLCYRTRNSSSAEGFSFITTQFGFEIDYRY